MKKTFAYGIALLFLLALSCKNKTSDTDSVIPNVPVNFLVNLDDNRYFNLKNDGGFVNISGIGVKGIILYRINATNYTAFERASPVNPYGACNIITMDPSRIFLEDTCANAKFDLQGNSSDGVSAYPLKKYFTELNNSKLQIFNINY